MTDARYETGGALALLGTLGTWMIDNPSEFVTVIVAVIGCVIMVTKYFEERRQRKQQIRLALEHDAMKKEEHRLRTQKLEAEIAQINQ